MHNMPNMPMCPMMMANMPMMPMAMPQMNMMPPMDMMEEMFEEDDRDEEYLAGMQGEICRKMMPYVHKAIDRMEQKHDMYEARPDKEMIAKMTEEALADMTKAMPDMLENMPNMPADRQYYGPQALARDLLGILIINELAGRRRRRRRRRPYGYPIYGYSPYGYDDYYYYD